MPYGITGLERVNQPVFYVQVMKEYLHSINERNVLDTVFYRLVTLPWFLVMLDVMSGWKATNPKA